MDSDEEAALTAIIIATLTENFKRKKGGRERNRFQSFYYGDNTFQIHSAC